jgi:hypothetical protein
MAPLDVEPSAVAVRVNVEQAPAGLDRTLAFRPVVAVMLPPVALAVAANRDLDLFRRDARHCISGDADATLSAGRRPLETGCWARLTNGFPSSPPTDTVLFQTDPHTPPAVLWGLAPVF